ncbi:MAG: hypothetical protein KF842_12370 [Caulobacter sp.]|nr:hypothetical protein [Caulobacter sp.]
MRLTFRPLEPDPKVEADPMVALISDALRHFQGAAHRDLVLAHVATALGRPARLSPQGAAEIIAAFEHYVGDGPDDPRPFRQPFGPDSHRWALKEAPQPRLGPEVIEAWRWPRRGAAGAVNDPSRH